MSLDQTGVSCTPKELVYLAALYGTDHLIGLPDPFFGWLAEEVGPALAQARASLAERGVIAFLPDGSMEISPPVASLLEACSAPIASFLVTYSPAGGAPSRHCFHLSPAMAVQLSSGAPDDPVLLAALENRAALPERVFTVLHLKERAQPCASGGAIPAALLTRLIAGSDPKAAGAELAEAGLHPEVTAALLATQTHSVASATFVRLTPGSGTEGFGYLEGENGFWLIRSSSRANRDWVELLPCTGGTIADEIRRMVVMQVPVS